MNMVIREYLAEFRLGRMKEKYGSYLWSYFYLGFYMLTVFPIFLWSDHSEYRVGNMIIYYVLVVLMLFSFYSDMLHPIGMTKLMYLCPMSASQRRQYLLRSYWFKIAVSIGVTGTVLLVLGALEMINWAYAGLMFLNMVEITLCCSLMMEKRMKESLEKKKLFMLSNSIDGWETFGIVFAMLIGFFMLLSVNWQNEMTGVMGIVMAVIMLVVELPLAIRTVRRVNDVIGMAMNYETGQI